MFVKTRIPKHTNCVSFYASNHADGYRLATLFMGKKGRLANILDVMEIRTLCEFSHRIWKSYITTSSTEWFGLDREDKPVIAVIHNPGPLADETFLRENYKVNRSQNHEFNVVPRKMFWDVIDGKYGAVEFMYLIQAIDEHNANTNKPKRLDKAQIENSKLVKTRVGRNCIAKDYLHAHMVGSILESMEQSQGKSGNIDTAFLPVIVINTFPPLLA